VTLPFLSRLDARPIREDPTAIPVFHRISILSLTPNSEFVIGSITYVPNQRQTNEPYCPWKPARGDAPGHDGMTKGSEGILERL